MDRSKKKNRNKRGNQRGNQNKGTDSAAPSAEEVVVPVPEPEPELVHASTPEQNENVEVQRFGASESDVEPERLKMDEEKCVKLREEVRQLEDEKRMWMQKEEEPTLMDSWIGGRVIVKLTYGVLLRGILSSFDSSTNILQLEDTHEYDERRFVWRGKMVIWSTNVLYIREDM